MTRRLIVHTFSAPVGQPRARHVPGVPTPVSTADKKVKAYRAHLTAEMRRQAERQGWKAPMNAVRVNWQSWHATRDKKRWGLYNTTKPDRDNIDKLILDCAQDAGIIPKGDQRVADGRLVKVWCKPGAQGLLIDFEDLDGQRPQVESADDLGAFSAV